MFYRICFAAIYIFKRFIESQRGFSNAGAGYTFYPHSPLASLDETWRHVHSMLKSRLTKDWYVQSWSMVVQFGTPKAYFFFELEKVQKRAARFVSGNYVDYETGSMTGILKQLKWESLKKRRKDSRLIMLYKGLKGAASIPTNDLIPPIRRTRNHHSLAFQIPMAGTDIYKSSFFPQTIRDWNLLTDSLISASECTVDSITKFTGLVRARD